MISAYHAQKHAETILEVLGLIAQLLGKAGQPAAAAIAMARAALASLTDPATPSDPADIRKAADLLRAELAKHDAKADAELAKKFPPKSDAAAAAKFDPDEEP